MSKYKRAWEDAINEVDDLDRFSQGIKAEWHMRKLKARIAAKADERMALMFCVCAVLIILIAHGIKLHLRVGGGG